MKRVKLFHDPRPPLGKGQWFLLSLILAAFLPFILRLGLDVNSVNRQALNRIYREWKVSESFQILKQQTDELRVLKSSREDVFEDLFQGLLQNDFKIVNEGTAPVITSYFEKSKVLTARLEWGSSDGVLPVQVFHSETRFVNNGLLLGFWISLILIFFKMETMRAMALTAFFMLLWQVRWNPADIPFYLWGEIRLNIKEFSLGMNSLESSLFFVLLALALVIAVFRFLAKPWLRKLPDEGVPQTLLLSLLAEPFILKIASQVMNWGEDIFWWKVY